jgi:hypothetical protein
MRRLAALAVVPISGDWELRRIEMRCEWSAVDSLHSSLEASLHCSISISVTAPQLTDTYLNSCKFGVSRTDCVIMRYF